MALDGWLFHTICDLYNHQMEFCDKAYKQIIRLSDYWGSQIKIQSTRIIKRPKALVSPQSVETAKAGSQCLNQANDLLRATNTVLIPRTRMAIRMHDPNPIYIPSSSFLKLDSRPSLPPRSEPHLTCQNLEAAPLPSPKLLRHAMLFHPL